MIQCYSFYSFSTLSVGHFKGGIYYRPSPLGLLVESTQLMSSIQSVSSIEIHTNYLTTARRTHLQIAWPIIRVVD